MHASCHAVRYARLDQGWFVVMFEFLWREFAELEAPVPAPANAAAVVAAPVAAALAPAVAPAGSLFFVNGLPPSLPPHPIQPQDFFTK